MAKSNRVKNYSIGKGTYKGYWGYEELRNILKDIQVGNKKWGTEWYEEVQNEFYESAKKKLEVCAYGEDKDKAINIINRIIAIRKEERGDK